MFSAVTSPLRCWGLMVAIAFTPGRSVLATVADARDGDGSLAVTTTQATAFGREIARTLSGGDPSFYNAHIDNVAIVQAGMSGLKCLEDAGRKSAPFTAKQKFECEGFEWKFLGTREENGHPAPILRLTRTRGLSSENYNAFQYIEFVLTSFPDGSIHALDILSTDTGELASESVHRYGLESIATDPHLASCLGSLKGQDTDYVAHYDELRKLDIDAISCADEASASEAEAIFTKLPTSLRQYKWAMRLHVFTSTGMGYGPFKTALAEFRRVYPDDIGESGRLINSFVILSQYQAALSEIDRVDRYVGGDPMLDVERGYASYHAEKPDAQKNFYRSAVEREPGLAPGWFGLIWLSLDRRQYDETVALLDESQHRAGLPWNRVGTSFLFFAFRNSPQYAKWVKKHPQIAADESHPGSPDWPNWGN